MTSKWLKNTDIDKFRKEKQEEKARLENGGARANLRKFPTPYAGTVDTPKTYVGRFLPSPDGEFYKRFYYHMFSDGDQWTFIMCSKTHEWTDYCPFCDAAHKLWKADKKTESKIYSRKIKYVANWYLLEDYRDEERVDDEKLIKTVMPYEFPAKLEQKLKKEITDIENGYGSAIFDPGKEGRNFYVNVLSTKKDKAGKSWPDYSTSEFARKPSALGTDKEIEKIMQQCINLNEYIRSQEMSQEEIIDILKDNFLYDMVSDELDKHDWIE